MKRTETTSKVKTLLAGFLLLIMSTYYVNSTMFFHQHTINGDTVSHSHFYSKLHDDSSSDGGHDIEIIKLIALLSNIAITEQTFDNHIEAQEALVESIIRAYNTREATFYINECRSLRAPPLA